ncbi:SCO6745 family protein [Nocardia pseudobrasiliensis]|uniref:EvbL n=1 Tax=Nocardia pseudobrasiliensis TaxID=45979 RepID=A0A370I2I1_9NOCA|nr:hypothetical protein [Nocardia pseudobrasiliensis]RDI63504.1 hypothetical protein DFR76_110201 [Nocardia pseudobrasiliensis]
MSVPAAVKQQIQLTGGAFMFSREAKAYARSTGVDDFLAPYTRGRGGVLGDVDAEVIVAAFGFFRPATVRAAWESVPGSAAEAATAYLRVVQDFGRRKLAAFERADRLAELLERVVGAAEVAGVPLFAGWRGLPLADDGAARAMQLLHVARELRGGLHLLAVRASGLSPLQAVLIAGSAVNDGPAQARLFGWSEPFEAISEEQRRRWESAEALTDTLIEPAFAVLDEAEGKELVDLVDAAQACVLGSR